MYTNMSVEVDLFKASIEASDQGETAADTARMWRRAKWPPCRESSIPEPRLPPDLIFEYSRHLRRWSLVLRRIRN